MTNKPLKQDWIIDLKEGKVFKANCDGETTHYANGCSTHTDIVRLSNGDSFYPTRYVYNANLHKWESCKRYQQFIPKHLNER